MQALTAENANKLSLNYTLKAIVYAEKFQDRTKGMKYYKMISALTNDIMDKIGDDTDSIIKNAGSIEQLLELAKLSVQY
jgi:hypothetical protein